MYEPEGLDYLLGRGMLRRHPLPPYSPQVLAVLGQLSSDLRRDPHARRHPDVQAFAFWCRTGNLEQQGRRFSDGRLRLGRGLAFHIAPSNAPVNFAFSYAFGLLAGNANIVRVPSAAFPQIDLIVGALSVILARPEHGEVARLTGFVRYERDDAITAALSADCDARIIWGGDDTIRRVRTAPLQARAVELTFGDRYSLAVIGTEAVLDLDDEGLRRLAQAFFNDAYLLDQAACSSPHLVTWLGPGVEPAQRRFWEAVQCAVRERPPLEPVQAVEKYTRLCRQAMDGRFDRITCMGNDVYRARVARLSPDLQEVRGGFGSFVEFEAEDLAEILPIVTPRCQTVTYFGVPPDSIARLPVDHGLRGIDRVVPIGSGLDISVTWDGYDVISSLSRIIDVR